MLFSRVDPLDAPANRATALAALPLSALMEHDPLVLVRLRLAQAGGAIVDENFYWRGRDAAAYRSLGNMPESVLQLRVSGPDAVGDEQQLVVDLRNECATPALNAKLTLEDAQGARVLPAYYSDNYVSLLPGETRRISVRIPRHASVAAVSLRGWNVQAARAAIAAH